MKIKVLVTGGAGFVASYVVDLLVQHGYDVVVVDNLSTGKYENLNPKAKFIHRDIQDKIIWRTLEPVDYVFHLAAVAQIQSSIKDPTNAHEVNVNGTLNVLEYCRRTGAKLIFSSSSAIYAGYEVPTFEEDDLEPASPYALQKLICEQYIKLYADLFNIKYTILRYFNVFGERSAIEGAYAAVTGIFLEQRKQGKPLTITGDGLTSRDFVYVKDVAIANVMAMDWPAMPINIGTGVSYSINEIATAVGGLTEYLPARQGEVRETLADINRARMLGWEPTTKILDWIATHAD